MLRVRPHTLEVATPDGRPGRCPCSFCAESQPRRSFPMPGGDVAVGNGVSICFSAAAQVVRRLPTDPSPIGVVISRRKALPQPSRVPVTARHAATYRLMIAVPRYTNGISCLVYGRANQSLCLVVEDPGMALGGPLYRQVSVGTPTILSDQLPRVRGIDACAFCGGRKGLRAPVARAATAKCTICRRCATVAAMLLSMPAPFVLPPGAIPVADLEKGARDLH